MKKILFGLIFSLLALQVNAASISLSADGDTDVIFAPVANAGPHSITLGGAPAGGLWETSLTIIDVAAGSIAGFGANVLDSSNNLVTTLNGNGAGITLDLALDTYTVNFFGTPAGNSFSWAMTVGIQEIQTSPVPVPAAVWLFGSALMGLVGVSRRKSTSVTA